MNFHLLKSAMQIPQIFQYITPCSYDKTHRLTDGLVATDGQDIATSGTHLLDGHGRLGGLPRARQGNDQWRLSRCNDSIGLEEEFRRGNAATLPARDPLKEGSGILGQAIGGSTADENHGAVAIPLHQGQQRVRERRGSVDCGLPALALSRDLGQ